MLAAILEREDPRDAFVSNRYAQFTDLPQGAVVGTSSLRRLSQLRALRPDLKIEPLRGNLDTRLRKLDDGEYDAIIPPQPASSASAWANASVTPSNPTSCCLLQGKEPSAWKFAMTTANSTKRCPPHPPPHLAGHPGRTRRLSCHGRQLLHATGRLRQLE